MELDIGQHFRKRSKYIRAFLFISAISALVLLFLYLSLYIYAKTLGPPELAVPQSTLYYSGSGSLIGETDNGQKRYWTDYQHISENLINATVAIEDRKFFGHHGFDIKRVGGAVIADIKAMGKVQGASTITQQYARNLYLTHDKNWIRKWNEAFYTMRLEMNYSKEEIMEGYLNTIYYGHGAYGVQAASRYYFNKDADRLSLAEASMLAGVPKGPGRYSPLVNFEKAKTRQRIILQSMVKESYITAEEADTAWMAPLKLNGKHQSVKEKTAPYFQDAVRTALKTQLGLDDRTIELGGLKVYTTLDEKLQKAAEETVSSVMTDGSGMQAALLAMEPQTGEVKALVGGKSYQESPFNRATQALRQPGSTIKPLLYYAALERGYTPSTALLSEPTKFETDGGKSVYTPRNYNNQYAGGEITLAQAIALSDNIYAVKTHLFLGQDTLVKTARRFGITAQMAAVPSLALGSSAVRPAEMVNAYNFFANGGRRAEPTFIRKVLNSKGEIIFEAADEHEQELDPAQTAVMTGMLTGVFDKKLNGYAKVTGSTISGELTRPYAGKSGSTLADSWMIGYTPSLTAGVWTGYDDARKIEVPAEKLFAKKIWARFMEKGLEGSPAEPFPETEGVIGAEVDPASGKLAAPGCPESRLTYYVKGTEPETFCDAYFLPDGPKDKPGQENGKTPWYKRMLKFWQ